MTATGAARVCSGHHNCSSYINTISHVSAETTILVVSHTTHLAGMLCTNTESVMDKI